MRLLEPARRVAALGVAATARSSYPRPAVTSRGALSGVALPLPYLQVVVKISSFPAYVALCCAVIACGESSPPQRQGSPNGDGAGTTGGSAGSSAGTGTVGSGGEAGSMVGTGGTPTGGAGTGAGGAPTTDGGTANGGSAGTGTIGAGGAGGAGGGGAGFPAVGCTGTELFCEDFEDDAVGAVPGSPWLMPAEYCASAGQFSTGVTDELKHGGSKAFKATNHRPPNCRLSAPFPQVDEFWLRAFIYWEEAVSFTNKEILAIDLHPASGVNTDDPAIRFGTRSKEPCTASAGPQITLIGFAGGERTGCNGTVQEPKGEWYCFEAHVIQSSAITVKTYVNGAEFTYESSGKAPTDTIGTEGAAGAKVDHVRIGLFTHDGSGVGSVYIDDIAIATTRLGCGGP